MDLCLFRVLHRQTCNILRNSRWWPSLLSGVSVAVATGKDGVWWGTKENYSRKSTGWGHTGRTYLASCRNKIKWQRWSKALWDFGPPWIQGPGPLIKPCIPDITSPLSFHSLPILDQRKMQLCRKVSNIDLETKLSTSAVFIYYAFIFRLYSVLYSSDRVHVIFL